MDLRHSENFEYVQSVASDCFEIVIEDFFLVDTELLSNNMKFLSHEC